MPGGDTMWFEEIFSNITLLFFYAFFLVYFIILSIQFYLNRANIRLSKNLALILISLFSWLSVLTLQYVINIPQLLYIIFFLRYAVSTVTVFAILLFVLKFHNLKAFTQKRIIVSGMVVPVLTVFLIAFGYSGLFGSYGFNLIRTNPYVNTEQINYVFGNPGVWHYADSVYTYLLAFIIAFVSVSQHFRLPKIYREPSKRLLFAVILILLGVAAEITDLATGEIFPVDFLMLGIFFSIRFLYQSTLGNQGLVFLSQARNDIINHLEQCILILDEDKNITYTNRKATEWLEQIGIEDSSYITLIAHLTETASQCERQNDEDVGSDFHFDNGGGIKVFNLREKPIVDKRNRQIGTYVVYSDVTENRALIQRLEVGAGRDALTGLHNRGMMEYLKTELDKPESLPFSVIVCDLNDLKKTNDTYGHQQGDIMLRVAGEALSTRCPPIAQAGRIGGDEFLILLPQTTRAEAEELISSINAHLKAIDEFPYKITLAMGAGTKETDNQTLDDIIIAADELMYENKKAIKGTCRDRAGAAIIA